MAYEATGTLHTIGETLQISERFTKREFVIELDDNPQYPQFIQFQLTGDRCDRIDDHVVGDKIKIEFNLRGREWTSPTTGEVKCFNSLDAWRIECVQQGARQDTGQGGSGGYTEGADPDEDLPFATVSIVDDVHRPGSRAV